MTIRVRSLALLGLVSVFSLSCGGPRRGSVAPTVATQRADPEVDATSRADAASASSPTSNASSAPPATGFCDRERAAARRVLEAGWNDDLTSREYTIDEELGSVYQCAEGANTTWLATPVSMEVLADCSGYVVRGELRAVENNAVVARRPVSWRRSPCMPQYLTEIRVGRFDAAPHDEVAIHLTLSIEEHFEVEPWWLYTLRGDRIEQIRLGEEEYVIDVQDVDRDGLLDLVRGDPYSPRVLRCEGGANVVQGPRRLAHATPDGRFSEDDAVATNFLRRECPSEPHELLVSRSQPARRWEDVDFVATMRAVSCANAYGWSGARVRHALSRLCRRYEDRCDAETYENPYPRGTCPRYVIEMADQSLPFTL